MRAKQNPLFAALAGIGSGADQFDPLFLPFKTYPEGGGFGHTRRMIFDPTYGVEKSDPGAYVQGRILNSTTTDIGTGAAFLNPSSYVTMENYGVYSGLSYVDFDMIRFSCTTDSPCFYPQTMLKKNNSNNQYYLQLDLTQPSFGTTLDALYQEPTYAGSGYEIYPGNNTTPNNPENAGHSICLAVDFQFPTLDGIVRSWLCEFTNNSRARVWGCFAEYNPATQETRYGIQYDSLSSPPIEVVSSWYANTAPEAQGIRIFTIEQVWDTVNTRTAIRLNMYNSLGLALTVWTGYVNTGFAYAPPATTDRCFVSNNFTQKLYYLAHADVYRMGVFHRAYYSLEYSPTADPTTAFEEKTINYLIGRLYT